MPEHVHLLVWPMSPEATAECISRFLAAAKLHTSQRVRADLQQSGSRLLPRLTIRERPGRAVFRYWREGPGYDRNLQTERAVAASIDYLHLNPFRRGLCSSAAQWRWSSARWYVSDGAECDADLPHIDGPPPDLFHSG